MGIPHPDYLLPMLTATQMRDWEIYSIAEPFGQPRADIMAGVIAAATVNIWRGKGEEAIQPCEMIGEAKPEPTREEMAAGLNGFMNTMGR
jgi:hypothetical protein